MKSSLVTPEPFKACAVRSFRSRVLVLASVTIAIGLFASEGQGKSPPAKKTSSAKPAGAPEVAASSTDDPSATPTVEAHPNAPDDRVRCKPSCYHTERPAKDFGKHATGCGYYEKGVYQDPTLAGWGPSYMGPSTSTLTSVPSCTFPKPGGGKWAGMQSWIKKNLGGQIAGDVIVVPANASWERSESSDGAVKRTVTFRWYTKKADFSVNACGTADQDLTCEADGSPAARAINVAHYRLDEAKKHKAANKNPECQQASLEAIATARGFAKNTVGFDFEGRFKTRFDGTLTKKALLANVTAIGKEAESAYKSCGGASPIKTTDDDEQAYHARW